MTAPSDHGAAAAAAAACVRSCLRCTCARVLACACVRACRRWEVVLSDTIIFAEVRLATHVYVYVLVRVGVRARAYVCACMCTCINARACVCIICEHACARMRACAVTRVHAWKHVSTCAATALFCACSAVDMCATHMYGAIVGRAAASLQTVALSAATLSSA